jgi:hypothetical protein
VATISNNFILFNSIKLNSINFLFTNVPTQQPDDRLRMMMMMMIMIIIIIINSASFLEKKHGLQEITTNGIDKMS